MKQIKILFILVFITICMVGCTINAPSESTTPSDPATPTEPNVPSEPVNTNTCSLVNINCIELSEENSGIIVHINITNYNENAIYGICYIYKSTETVELYDTYVTDNRIDSINIINNSYNITIGYIDFYTSSISISAYVIEDDNIKYSNVTTTSMIDLANNSSSEYASQIISDCSTNEPTLNIVTITIDSLNYTNENNSEYYTITYNHDKNYEKNTVVLTMTNGYHIGDYVSLQEIDNSSDENSNIIITQKEGTQNGRKYTITIENDVLTYIFEDRNWSPFY